MIITMPFALLASCSGKIENFNVNLSANITTKNIIKLDFPIRKKLKIFLLLNSFKTDITQITADIIEPNTTKIIYSCIEKLKAYFETKNSPKPTKIVPCIIPSRTALTKSFFLMLSPPSIYNYSALTS